MKSIREFLNRLHIGYKCRSVSIKVPFTTENSKIIQFFYDKSWIKMYNIRDKNFEVYLRYVNNKPLFTKIKFISTPGYRRYFSKEGVQFYKKFNGGNAHVLLHSSLGLLTLKSSEKLSIGGEISYILYD